MPITAVTPVDVKALRQHLALARETLKEAYLKNPQPAKLLSQWRRTVDDVLKRLWIDSGFSPRSALAAVGGYGRGELYPYSDIDLLLLMPETLNADTAQRIERLIGVLWDIGLEVGHSVRTLSECMSVAQQDLTIATTLTDVRHLSGSIGAIARLRIALVQHATSNITTPLLI